MRVFPTWRNCRQLDSLKFLNVVKPWTYTCNNLQWYYACGSSRISGMPAVFWPLFDQNKLCLHRCSVAARFFDTPSQNNRPCWRTNIYMSYKLTFRCLTLLLSFSSDVVIAIWCVLSWMFPVQLFPMFIYDSRWQKLGNSVNAVCICVGSSCIMNNALV